MRRLPLLFLALLCGLLAFAARTWNVREVFVADGIYFVDADCYSRMTRARMISEGGGWIIHQHEFENWPQGTRPHTTAPMDWAILAGKGMIDITFGLFDFQRTSVLRRQSLDLAGALISPLLGALTCVWLTFWAAAVRSRQDGGESTPPGLWLAAPFFFAISPVLVHGTLLGRPDHQSLLILLLAVALGAEMRLFRGFTRGWGITAGTAWALACWVSLYEPAILFALVLLAWGTADRRRFTAREMLPGWIALSVVLVVAFVLDGWRLTWPDAELREVFARWKLTIGELASVDPRTPALYRWLGAGLLLAPALLVLAGRRDRLAWTILGLLAATFALTVWQARWSYFLALVFALSLPWQLAVLRRSWIAWPVFFLALWPVAQDWDEKLFPADHPELALEKKRGLLRLEAVRLREVAERMRGAERQPFLAPWWLSPALAYWSGQPGVAGSSHESLPGIVASARFFLAPGPADAERLARERGVYWILTDEPERLLSTSRVLLGTAADATTPFIVHLHESGEPRERVQAEDLRSAPTETRRRLLAMAARAEADVLGSPAFSCVSTHQFYKLFRLLPPAPEPSAAAIER